MLDTVYIFCQSYIIVNFENSSLQFRLTEFWSMKVLSIIFVSISIKKQDAAFLYIFAKCFKLWAYQYNMTYHIVCCTVI